MWMVSFFYDFVGDTPGSPKQYTDLLHAIGLITVLLLAILTQIPVELSPEEFQVFDRRVFTAAAPSAAPPVPPPVCCPAAARWPAHHCQHGWPPYRMQMERAWGLALAAGQEEGSAEFNATVLARAGFQSIGQAI